MKLTLILASLAVAAAASAQDVSVTALKNATDQNYRVGVSLGLLKCPVADYKLTAYALTDAQVFGDLFDKTVNGRKATNFYTGLGVEKPLFTLGKTTFSASVGYTTQIVSLKEARNGNWGFGLSAGVRF